ncbi:Hypothetical predicted protein [Olea europaea subsp. europaea]|uniref:Uncharacterized protein n=1 Tax=Olea europaea subsp. europaea TaxID=158383 RepID=A0A8S0SY05_OLEEU|nr:Hypothetical predicted protein [Olea europaea subsp. europaea]
MLPAVWFIFSRKGYDATVQYMEDCRLLNKCEMNEVELTLKSKRTASRLVKAVFDFETLAAGIDMPARTAVISSLSKRTGSGRTLLTSNELLQMARSAGRRGIDKKFTASYGMLHNVN